MPDEYLPPNNILFIQNLPEETTQDDLREVFEVHAGLVEIRTIPSKKDIAFVEFADEAAATVAKDALHNFKIDGETKMKVTYARK
jgi:RNA recognition motif-containing protein